MKNTLALVAILATTIGTAAAQGGGTPATGVQPNYKPGGAASSSKPAGQNVVTRSGGQGHNSGPDPKGKVVVAPTTPAHSSKRTKTTTPGSNQ
jgi:hypothetical protein